MSRRQPYSHNLNPPSALADPEIIEDKDGGIEIRLEEDPVIQVSDAPASAQPEIPEQPLQVHEDPVPDPEPASLKPSADDEAFSRLKAQLDREKQAREAAQRRAQQLETDHFSAQERLRVEQERAQVVQREHLDAQELAVDNAISYAESQSTTAQREIARALSEGDYEASTNAYTVLAKAQSDLGRLQEGKTAIATQKKQPSRQEPAQQQQYQQAPQTQWERIEAYINQPAHSPRAQQYMREHYDDLFRDFDSGAARLHKLLGSHYLSKGDGIVENSDDYYRFLDKQMGYAKDREAPVTQTAAPTPKKSVPPSAPVSRASSPTDGSSATAIRLTKAQVDFCRESGIDPTSYARQLLRARNGASDPNYNGPRFSSDQR